eukprot:m.168856 g.168856  ORF g.168856 m.168856 type:complete len:349 (-) comp13014_c0_seq1:276-1322(-)
MSYENIAAISLHGRESARVHASSLMQLRQLMLEADDEDGEDYVNQEAVRLHESGTISRPRSGCDDSLPPTPHINRPQDCNFESNTRSGLDSHAVAGEDDESTSYVNQEAIELHQIDALQPWMHGPIDRAEAERRLGSVGQAGVFLVRVKGITGRCFVFSMLVSKGGDGKFQYMHNLIEFADVDAGTVFVDSHKLPRPCKSLKSVVKVICYGHNKKFLAKGQRLQMMGVRDMLLEMLEGTEDTWHLPTLTRPDAEKALTNHKPGTFLLRNAKMGGKCFSIRLPHNSIVNIKVDTTPDGFCVGGCQLPPLVQTISELARAIIVDVAIISKTHKGVAEKLRPLHAPKPVLS